MPLIERLLHPVLADDTVRPVFQSFGVASDVDGRLGSCGGLSTSTAAAIVNRRRSRLPRHSSACGTKTGPLRPARI
ncbi:MAG: hypothetical protein WC340_11050 [Kiritimatiellia bacterium]